MHQALQIVGWWALAFLSLGAALVCLNLFYNLIDNDLELLSWGKETSLAAVASLIEGASVWAVASYIPRGGRALLIPALVVALLYKIAHYQDWNHYDIFALLMFQVGITTVAACFWFGHFSMAFGILLIFFICLAVVYAFGKGL